LKKKEKLEYVTNKIDRTKEDLEKHLRDGNEFYVPYYELDLLAFQLLRMYLSEKVIVDKRWLDEEARESTV
jgi:hypothetical protein